MAVYTKTGDKGETKVFDNKTGQLIKVPKTSCQIAAIGAIDELNSYLGIVKSEGNKETLTIIGEIQKNLFVINSILAGSKLRFPKSKVKKLEKQIDHWEGTLPVLQNFIIYGGDRVATEIYFARALTRKAERAMVEFSGQVSLKNTTPQIYLNRLSDYLFMFARYLNKTGGDKEEYWKGSGR
jgi:cob(I)alamin adenosyltransferase